MESISEIWDAVRSGLEFKLIELGGHSISIYNIVVLIIILIGFRVLVKALEKLIKTKAS